MGPYTTRHRHELGYHLTVGDRGFLIQVRPVFIDNDTGKHNLAAPWHSTGAPTVGEFAKRYDFDRLFIHVPGNSEPKEQKTMKLTNRQSVIVSLLRIHGVEGNTVATSTFQVHTGMPAASVRRNIASLRNKGFNIESTPTGYTLLGELGTEAPVVPVTSPAQSEADDLRDEYSAPEYHEGDPGDENDWYGDDDLEGDYDPFDDGGDL